MTLPAPIKGLRLASIAAPFGRWRGDVPHRET
ncbi:MAG: hypothetical protein ACJA1L_002556 [Paracoccaceae bacterium]|jgi:hypothetical protein